MLLTAALLTTLCAAAAPDIHAYSWSPVPDEVRHITPMLWVRRDSKPAELAAQTAARPEGRRVLFSWDLHRDLLEHPDDVCRTADDQPTTQRGVWPEHGVKAVRARFEQFFAEFKAAGGQLDLFVLDFEGGYSNWSIGGADKADRYRAIAADPRFEELAIRLGFNDLMTVANYTSGRNYLRWNAVLGANVDKALEEAVFAPIRRLFPAARACNYGSYAMTERNAVPDINGHMQYTLGQGVGTHQSSDFYCGLGQVGDKTLAGTRPLGRSPFAGMLRSLNQLRAMQRSSARPIMPWVAWPRYAGDGPGAPVVPIAGTPYYRELVLHLALAGCDTMLLWNPHPWAAGQKPEDLSMPDDERLLDGILADLNRRITGPRRTPVSTAAVAWDARYVATGLRLDDKILWRVTLDGEARKLSMRWLGNQMAIPLEPDTPGAWCITSPGAEPDFKVE
ncbi:MAG: hypothetical protein HZB16_20360 [Armatimonadetes bacterium]|nr:hypothetical protein [Armatimonadota bacterium]